MITEEFVRKLVATVDVGLSRGVGDPIPGQMCVEAAISYALGEPHSDRPSCVDPVVRAAQIQLNDGLWSSSIARARGMRAVAIAQLGSKGTIDPVKFASLLSEYVIREIVPIALRSAATLCPDHAAPLGEAAVRCEREGTFSAARSAESAAWSAADSTGSAESAFRSARSAAWSAADSTASAESAAESAAASARSAARGATSEEADRVLSICATLMVRALRECGSPGCEYLWLLDEIPLPKDG